jgi:hypothetical protein
MRRHTRKCIETRSSGQGALVVTSPPYGPTVHGLVRPGPRGVEKRADRYSDQPDRRNLAHRNWTGLVDGFTRILQGCRELLRPGGTVVVTARPWRKNGHLVDLPTAVITAGLAAGLHRMLKNWVHRRSM